MYIPPQKKYICMKYTRTALDIRLISRKTNGDLCLYVVYVVNRKKVLSQQIRPFLRQINGFCGNKDILAISNKKLYQPPKFRDKNAIILLI